jgi:hypothetical protein
MWCVDGASTTFATFDRTRCFNIQPCSVSIFGPNADDNFLCTEVGDCHIDTYDKATGKTGRMLATNVLINTKFPFHIFSEIIAFEKHCTATKSLGSWQLFSPDSHPIFHASQRLLNKTSGHSDVKLYFVDEKPDPMSISTDTKEVMAAIHSPSLSSGAADQSKSTAKVHNSPSQTSSGNAEGFNAVTKVNAAKNLQMLLELHCAHDHWNFEDVAIHYGLTLPNPRPECWACLLAKPRRITHDKVSTRQCTRASEGFSADAKDPFDTPTPEGYLYFF